MNKEIKLRAAEPSDVVTIFHWRNNPLIYQGSYTQRMQNRQLTWTEHEIWYNTRQNWKCFIIQLAEVGDIGYVNISQLDSWTPEIGYAIGEPSLWGRGHGKRAVELTLDWLREHGYKYTHATVLDDGERSIRLLQSLGFECRGKARPGESWWMKDLSKSPEKIPHPF